MFLETSRGKYVGFILALGVTDLLGSFEVPRGRERSSKRVKCIIPKSSKKRVRPLLCATLVPHLWHMWHKYKCATLLWHKGGAQFSGR